MFKDFEFRLYPTEARLDELRQLSLHPTIASRLKSLCYESGIQLEYADFRYWKAKLYQSETSNFDRGIAPDGASQEDHQQSHRTLETRFGPNLEAQYENYRRWLDNQAGVLANSPQTFSVFASVLSKCLSLTTIKLSTSEPEITLDELTTYASKNQRYTEPDNVRPATRIGKRRRNCLSHFTSLLEAVYSSSRVVTDLVAIGLPKAIFNTTDYEADILKGVFYPLQNLDLKIGKFPHSYWFQPGGFSSYFRGRNIAPLTLGRLLNEPKDLQRLALSFPTGWEAAFSFEIFDRTNLDR